MKNLAQHHASRAAAADVVGVEIGKNWVQVVSGGNRLVTVRLPPEIIQSIANLNLVRHVLSMSFALEMRGFGTSRISRTLLVALELSRGGNSTLRDRNP